MYNCQTHYKIDMKNLTITQRKDSQQGFNLYSSNLFFKNKKEVVFDYDDWGVYFRIPSIDDDNTINIHKNGLNSYQVSIYNVDLTVGNLILDESESNEDEIYFNYLWQL